MKRAPLVFAALALVLTACAGGDTTDTTTTTALETSTTGDEVTTTIAASTTSVDTTTSAPTASGGGEGCLVGDWELDDEKFFDSVFASFGDGTAGVGDVVPGDGEFTITFGADGTIDAVRDDWGFTVQSGEGDFKIVIDGDQTGTWATDGSTLTLSLEEASTFEITTSLVVDGQEVELPQAPFDVPAEALSATSEYSCDNDTLLIITEEFTSEFNRA
jgi:hypothetical protein